MMKWSAVRDYGASKAGRGAQVTQGLRLLVYGGSVYGFGGFSYEPALDFQNVNDPWQWYARTRTEIFRYTPSDDEWSLLGLLPRI